MVWDVGAPLVGAHGSHKGYPYNRAGKAFQIHAGSGLKSRVAVILHPDGVEMAELKAMQ